MKFQDIVAKYGLIVVLMIVSAIIGLALYLWKREEDSKEARDIRTAGLAIAIIGFFVGFGAIGYQYATTKKDSQNGNGNGTTPPPSNGGSDQLPAGA